MSVKTQARIIGMGSYLPKRVLTNQDFEKMVDTTDEWIVTRTGIKERRIAAEDEFTSDMGTAAARKALDSCGVSPDEIDLILVATLTPDYISNATGALIQTALGASKAAAVDIQAACSGFIYALSMAKAYIESGMYKNILLVASERMSTYVNYKDRGTCILFGDGAAAAVVSTEGEGLAIKNVCLGADGKLAEIVYIPGGGSRHPPSERSIKEELHYFRMEGKEVFKHAVRKMGAAAKECLDKAGLTTEQINWFVPHQANLRIMDALAKNFQIPDEKMYKTVQKYGNTSASSLAIALDELMQEHALNFGDNILLVAFGAGLAWGASLLKKIGK